ncbi:hypothetical protein [Pseudogracilibacillus sp. SO30301A]|uniref:hypothetical protein n=1 Tax=Pseudogracilibacillus sp. SO30301A TaxID=3098291 RepID=UPI00300DD577
MKQTRIFFFLIIFMLVASCSSDYAVELVQTQVEIVKDKEKTRAIVITEGEQKGQELVPTVLHYEFTIKNIGSKKINQIEDKNLEIKIQPHDTLIASSKNIIGFNIFNPSEYQDTGLGHGKTYATSIEPDQEEKFSIYFELGVSEENSEVSQPVPSKKALQELTDQALEATLVIVLDEEEIARFDMEP